MGAFADRGDVELPGLGERAHPESQVPDEGHHREHLEQRRPGEVERHLRAGRAGVALSLMVAVVLIHYLTRS